MIKIKMNNAITAQITPKMISIMPNIVKNFKFNQIIVTYLTKFKIKIKENFSTFTSSLMVMLDDTRGGLDASSLHRATSKYKSLANKIRLLSCHRDHFIHRYNKA